ncbi:MAG: RDD family protein [Pseudomonadota bacterium]
MQNKQIVRISPPSLLKLGACLIYDALVIIALSFACALLFVWLLGEATQGVKHYLLQLFLWLSIGVYFVWCWHKSGQTLAMQAWKLKLVTQEDVNQAPQLLTFKLAIARYALASVGLMLFGVGFLWVIVDRDTLFLHDRLLKTQIISNYLRST